MGDYNAYDQNETAAQAKEQQELDALIRSYTEQIQSLGGVPNIPNSWHEAATQDVSKQAQSNIMPKNAPKAFLRDSIPTYGAYRAIQGRKAWRKSQGDAAHKQQQIESLMAAMQTAVEQKRAQQGTARGERERTNLSQMVSGMFDDPTRKNLYDRVYKTNLDNNLAQVNDAYKSALTSTVTRTADQGLTGGTVDTQRRADTAAARDKGAAGAANAAASASGAIRNQDTAMRQQLMELINSGDPTLAAQARAQLNRLGVQRQTTDQSAAGNQGQWSYDDYNTMLQSQALGGFAGAGQMSVRQNSGLSSLARSGGGSGG